MENNHIILYTKGLSKTFTSRKGRGKTETVEAVKGVDIEVRKGEIFGFLGPNGAGKTTTLKMLTTLLAPTKGEARVVGFDLHTQPEEIRKHIGYVSQAGGSDVSATARENLVLQAQLYGLIRVEAESRAAELIDRLQLAEFADRKSLSYSGGQRRRLDLALGLVHKPELLFLDEPTLGLDPQSRAHFWDEIVRLHGEGMTIFLTTHYLDEADKLCHRLAIIDHGVIATEGSPAELKKQIKGDSVVLGFSSVQQQSEAKRHVTNLAFVKEALDKENNIHLYIEQGEKNLPEIIRALDSKSIPLSSIELAKPSLDDVFLHKTGRSLRETNE